MVMIIEVPVASFSPPEEIEEWVQQLERAKHDPDAEPFDLEAIDMYIARANGWLRRQRERPAKERQGTG